MAGCVAGDDAKDDSSTLIVRAAPDATLARGSARVAMNGQVTITVDGSPEDAQFTADGLVDFRNRTSALTATLPAGDRVEVRTFGADVYADLPPELREDVPGTSTWLRFDAEQVSTAEYGAAIHRREGEPGDPWALLGLLRVVRDPVVDLGAEKVRGVRARRYEGVADLSKLPVDDAASRRALEKLRQQSGMKTVRVQVWVDENGLARRVSAVAPLRISATEAASRPDDLDAKVAVTENFYDFGTSVSVAKPRPEETKDVTDWVRKKGFSAVSAMAGLSPSATGE